MKKQTPLIKAILVAVIVAVLGYIGLDIPKEVVEVAVKTQLEDVTTHTEAAHVYVVDYVIDGDTVEVSNGSLKETVRLLGIDTPETRHAAGIAECYSEEATMHAKELLENTEVIVTTDPSQDERDMYGRLLGYVTLPDGTDFGARMVAEGFAQEYTYKDRAYAQQATYQQSEQAAKDAGLGLWGCE